DAERTARALAPDHAELADLVTGLDRTAEALAARRLALEASVPEFAGVLREALPTFIELNELFPTARAFAREVRPGLREAPATLRLASAIQHFDGAGHAVRYHAGFGDQTITTGQVSGLTEPLVALTESKILGSRPRKPSTGLPPFRPDIPCITQKPPNLQAATGPG